MILGKLKTKYIGRNLLYRESIDSTQKEAWRLIEQNIQNGSLIMADIQTEGIGTHGRKWHTDEVGNIAFSIVLYPNCKLEKLKDVTIDIANIIVKVFEKLYQIKLNIKNPNDIVYNGKKLGGILTETKVSGEIVKDLVIGIGINLKQDKFCDDIKDIATSIKKEFGIAVDRNYIISEICNMLEINVMAFCDI